MAAAHSPRKVVIVTISVLLVCLAVVHWYSNANLTASKKTKKPTLSEAIKAKPATVVDDVVRRVETLTAAAPMTEDEIRTSSSAVDPSVSSAMTETDDQPSVIEHYIQSGVDPGALAAVASGREVAEQQKLNASDLRFSVAKMTKNVTYNFSKSSRRIYGRFSIKGQELSHVLVELLNDQGARQAHVLPVVLAEGDRVFSLHRLPEKLTAGRYQVNVYRMQGKLPLEAQGQLVIEAL